MAKINKSTITTFVKELVITPIKKRYLHFQVNRYEAKIAFAKEYTPIYLEELESYQAKKMAQYERIVHLFSHSLKIKAGVLDEAIKEDQLERLQKVRSRFYWKHRALVNRLGKKEDQKEQFEQEKQKLHQALQAAEAKVLERFEPSSDLESAKQALADKLSKLQSKQQARLSSLEQRCQQKHQKALLRQTNTLSTYEAKLAKAEAVLNQLQGSNQALEASLEPGVILKLDKLSMHFGGLKAVNELSFEVKRGEIFGLIGPNGAGKTTVFNCITRFYKATSGKVYYRNRFNEALDLADFKVHQVIKEGIVRTFQNVELIWELNVLENLLVAAHTLYKTKFFAHLLNTKHLRQEDKIMRQKAMKILSDLNLTNYMYFYPLGLPYGILKKVELARTLMVNPDLIILDEPAAGLNDTETESLKATIKQIQQQYNATIFLVEHDMGLVMDVCDTVCAISFGKMLAIGSPKAIQQSKVVRDAYLGGE